MKYSFPVSCNCGGTFAVHVSGSHVPRNTECPNCHAPITLVEPLGNVVGMAILGRAAQELKNEDWSLAIVLAAIAVECELVYLFMKWNRIDLMLVRNPTDADEKGWEVQWAKWLSIALRLNKVSQLLTAQSFNSFLSTNADLLKAMHAKYPASATVASPRDFFIQELFHRRNKIVHKGETNFQKADGEMCVYLATIVISRILAAMDAHRYKALQAKW